VRVSATIGREGDSFQSPLQQRQAISSWARTTGVEIAGWHKDIDRSGGDMHRPGLERLLTRIRNEETGGVAVAWLDRFSRANVGDALKVVEEIRAHHGRVVALDVAGLEADDPFGEYALTMMLAMSRMQLRRIAERWAISRRNAIERGVQIGPIPFGYRADADRHLIIEPYEATAVRGLFERKARGETPLELARWLDEAAPRGDGRLWPRATVRAMIASKTYLGRVSHGHDLVNEHAHEPIVSPALWRRAQSDPGVHPGRNPRMELARVVRCASCGHYMKGSVQSGSGRRMYRCSQRFASGICPRPTSITAQPLETEVAAQLLQHLDGDSIREASERVELAACRREVKEASEALALYVQLTPTSKAGVDSHNAGISERETRLAAAEQRMLQLVDAAEHVTPDAAELRKSWPALPPAERRRVFRECLDAVLVRHSKSRSPRYPAADRIRVLFRGEAPAELRGIVRTTRTWAWDDGSPVYQLDARAT
jgi:DNA invertase Pin-like site-specific DNA recombinase